jgi:hypothetical protein
MMDEKELAEMRRMREQVQQELELGKQVQNKSLRLRAWLSVLTSTDGMDAWHWHSCAGAG